MRRSALALVLALSSAGLTRAAGPFDEFLKHASANTNVIALIDVSGAFSSPLAQAEKWREKTRAGGDGALGFVPADAEAVVITSEVNLNSLTRDFQIGMVRVARNVPQMNELARRENGSLDEIAGRLAVLSPRNVYFTTLPGAAFVAVYPADRQYTARWLRAVQANQTGQLAPYLRKAADASAGNAVTVAIDLQDVVDRNILQFSLAGSPSLAKNKTTDIPRLAGFLAQVQGLTFTAKVTDAVTGTLAVEFAGDPTQWRHVLPSLLLELIDSQGVWISGMDKWEVKFTNNTISLTGPMATADLKRVLSLFAFPQLGGDQPADPKAAANPDAVAAATRRYLGAVETILADVRNMRENPDFNKMATWNEKAAVQIENLNRQNVDPVAVDAAFGAARRLRAIANSLRGVPIDLNALDASQYAFAQGGGGMSVGFGWWGWRPFWNSGPTFVQTNIPEVQAKMAQVVADDQKKRLDAWSQIEKLMVDARLKLSEKYGGKF
jgi:hypothetical protein